MLIAPECVVLDLEVNSKRQALQALARPSAKITRQPESYILEVLLERERLGSTGLGEGTAVPHGRLDGLQQLCGVFARLACPIPFDAADDQPVDLLFGLLAPPAAGTDHLRALAQVSRMLCDRKICETLRGCKDREVIYQLLCSTLHE